LDETGRIASPHFHFTSPNPRSTYEKSNYPVFIQSKSGGVEWHRVEFRYLLDEPAFKVFGLALLTQLEGESFNLKWLSLGNTQFSENRLPFNPERRGENLPHPGGREVPFLSQRQGYQKIGILDNGQPEVDK